MAHWSPDKVDDVVKYVEDAIKSFIIDPPDSTYQRGYLDALLIVWTEAFDMPDSDDITTARNILQGARCRTTEID